MKNSDWLLESVIFAELEAFCRCYFRNGRFMEKIILILCKNKKKSMQILKEIDKSNKIPSEAMII